MTKDQHGLFKNGVLTVKSYPQMCIGITSGLDKLYESVGLCSTKSQTFHTMPKNIY